MEVQVKSEFRWSDRMFAWCWNHSSSTFPLTDPWKAYLAETDQRFRVAPDAPEQEPTLEQGVIVNVTSGELIDGFVHVKVHDMLDGWIAASSLIWQRDWLSRWTPYHDAIWYEVTWKIALDDVKINVAQGRPLDDLPPTGRQLFELKDGQRIRELVSVMGYTYWSAWCGTPISIDDVLACVSWHHWTLAYTAQATELARRQLLWALEDILCDWKRLRKRPLDRPLVCGSYRKFKRLGPCGTWFYTTICDQAWEHIERQFREETYEFEWEEGRKGRTTMEEVFRLWNRDFKRLCAATSRAQAIVDSEEYKEDYLLMSSPGHGMPGSLEIQDLMWYLTDRIYHHKDTSFYLHGERIQPLVLDDRSWHCTPKDDWYVNQSEATSEPIWHSLSASARAARRASRRAARNSSGSSSLDSLASSLDELD